VPLLSRPPAHPRSPPLPEVQKLVARLGVTTTSPATSKPRFWTFLKICSPTPTTRRAWTCGSMRRTSTGPCARPIAPAATRSLSPGPVSRSSKNGRRESAAGRRAGGGARRHRLYLQPRPMAASRGEGDGSRRTAAVGRQRSDAGAGGSSGDLSPERCSTLAMPRPRIASRVAPPCRAGGIIELSSSSLPAGLRCDSSMMPAPRLHTSARSAKAPAIRSH
jgi:hypothetical protein